MEEEPSLAVDGPCHVILGNGVGDGIGRMRMSYPPEHFFMLQRNNSELW